MKIPPSRYADSCSNASADRSESIVGVRSARNVSPSIAASTEMGTGRFRFMRRAYDPPRYGTAWAVTTPLPAHVVAATNASINACETWVAAYTSPDCANTNLPNDRPSVPGYRARILPQAPA
jgi:hypothetical protein